MPPVIDEKKCVKCGLCAQICPMDVIKVEKKNEQKEIVVKYPNDWK